MNELNEIGGETTTKSKRPTPITEDLSQAIEDLRADKLKGIETGFTRTDQETRGLSGLVILGGEPGIGKSSWALAVALKVSKRGEPVIYYSLEMPRLLLQKRALLACSPDVGNWETLLKSPAKMDEAQEELEKAGRDLHIWDTTTGTGDINSHIWGTVEQYEKASPLVIVDHGRLVNVTTDQGEPVRFGDSLTRQEDLLSELLNITQRTNATILLVSELNKEQIKQGSMNMSGVKGSVSAIYNASLILGLYDPKTLQEDGKRQAIEAGKGKEKDPYKPVRLEILKNRNGVAGQYIPYNFYGEGYRFEEDK